MSEHMIPLVRRERVLHEGAELVRVRMPMGIGWAGGARLLPGLKQFAHRQSDAAEGAEAP